MSIVAKNTLGLYVSVPFCRAKCSFCNFSSDVGTGAQLERYVTALCGELRGARERFVRLGLHVPEVVDTLYFGGGTPSLLQPDQLRRIFAAMRESFALDPSAEITMEAAPGQIANDLLEEAQSHGVNRISLGVQSFVDREAVSVGRMHTAEDSLAEVKRLRRAGIAEVGVDLIAGLPYQTTESWQHSLSAAAGVEITHLSVYMLETDEDSRLGREVLAGGARFHAHAVGSDELIADLYEISCEWLPRHGFAQYEISNFARLSGSRETSGMTPACHESRHNRKYWERAPYLGLGLDAHSMLFRGDDGPAVRFANSDAMHDYEMAIQGIRPAAVSRREAFEEEVFLGLRLNAGLSSPRLRASFPGDWVDAFEAAAEELVSEGLLTSEEDRRSMTVRGRLLSNEVFGRLLEPMAA